MRYFNKSALFFMIVFLFVSCNESDIIYKKTGEDFDNNGGVYRSVDGGVTVIIPPDALPDDVETVTITAYRLDTPAMTNVSKPVTNIYSISPAAVQFKKDLTVNIFYKEANFPNLLDELDLKPYFSVDRQNFEPVEKYELDVENNLIKMEINFLGNFHIGFPKELVKDKGSSQSGIAEMVLIPAGEFEFGAPEGTKTGATSENELQESEGFNRVYLSSYYIDKYEVTNSQYRLCMDAGVCTEPYDVTSILYQNYFYNANYAGFPVIWVTYGQAETFCQWAGKTLPTEAQWEKAARGSEFRIFPWGETGPTDNIETTIANYSAIFGDVTIAIWGDEGTSPYGVYNMAGNVAEWTSTWHNIDTYYHKRTDGVVVSDPVSPAESPTNEKVIKGGSWVSLTDEITTFARDKAFPNYRYYNLGFRCVQSVSE